MGFDDRDYQREEAPGLKLRTPQTVIGVIVLINVVIYVIDGIFAAPTGGGGKWLSDFMAVHVGTALEPWNWWKFLTYGFAHSPRDFGHIFGNMLTLWLLGRDVEAQYGGKEFARIYLAMILLGSIAWSVIELAMGVPRGVASYGASAAVTGVVVFYAMNFPRRMLLLFFVLPVPAWAVGALIVLYDLSSAMSAQGANINHIAHLAGAAFAFCYCHWNWNLSRWTSFLSLPGLRGGRPRLRVHHPEPTNDADLSDEVDRILEKLHREGEASLTRKERSTLEEASRRYQDRQRR